MTSPDTHPQSQKSARPRSIRDAILNGAWFGMAVGFVACVFDTLTLVWSGRVSPAEVAQSLAANAFFYQLTGASLGALLYAGWVGLAHSLPDAPVSPAAWYRGLSKADTARRLGSIANIYAFAIVGSAFLLACFFMVRDLGLRIADRNHLALLVLVGQLALLLGSAAAWVTLRRTLCGGLARLQRNRPQLASSVGLHGAIVCVAFASGVALVALAFWPALSQIDLRYLASPALALIGTAAAASALGRHARIARRTLLGSVLVTGALGYLTRGPSGPAIGGGWAQTPAGQLSRSWGRVWFDWDRDGQLSAFGELDCNGFDARVHPGAPDTPGNGVDEDCDGADARQRPPSPRRSRNYALPSSWPGRPNLYLLTIDAFATNTLQTYGGRAATAPNLDRLAKDSVVFDNYFVQGPSTRLSLPSLFTSRFDTQVDRLLKGHFPFELQTSNLMLAEVLKGAGYQTRAVLPNPYFLPERWRGLLQGFDRVSRQPAEAASQGVNHTADLVTEQALALIDQPREGPLFLWAHYFDAHPPHQRPPGQPAGGNAPSDLYLSEITHVDYHMGKLLQYIEKNDDNCVIVVTGDHGIAFDRPRHENVHYAYDLSTPVLHVPLIVRSPHLASRRVTDLASALDLAPTLVNLAGTPRPAPFLGQSLVPSLFGLPNQLPRVRFAQMYIGENVLRGGDPLRLVSARTLDLNLVLDRRTGQFQAWHWQSDPEERHDVWSDTALAAKPDGNTASADQPFGDPTPVAPPSERTSLRRLKDALDAHLYEACGQTVAARSQ